MNDPGYSNSEKRFFERNCPTCVYNDYKEEVMARLQDRPTTFKCIFGVKYNRAVMTTEQSLKVIRGIGHTFHQGDCPEYKEE